MGAITGAIAGNITELIGFGEMLCADIPEDRFARFATKNGTPIVSNHPAFIIGHLCLYTAYTVEAITGSVGDAAHPDTYPELFIKGTSCRDDPDGDIYPGKDELVTRFRTSHLAVLQKNA